MSKLGLHCYTCSCSWEGMGSVNASCEVRSSFAQGYKTIMLKGIDDVCSKRRINLEKLDFIDWR